MAMITKKAANHNTSPGIVAADVPKRCGGWYSRKNHGVPEIPSILRFLVAVLQAETGTHTLFNPI
jgi:hypothetical protein